MTDQDRPRQVYPRKRGRVVCRYGVERLDKTAFTMNLSYSGAFLRTNNVYKPGTRLQVELDLGAQKINLWAQVRWAKRVPPQLAHTLRCGMGVHFLNPGEDWKNAFEHWQVGKTTL